MKKLGIIQPGRLGDVIILLPAMKYLHDKGYQIYWPIFENYIWMFVDVVDYVNFLPVHNCVQTCVRESYNLLQDIYKVDEIRDIACTFPDSVSTDEYMRRGDGLKEPFDVYKYELLKVPLEEKWNLSLTRNLEMEDRLFNKIVKKDKYIVYTFNFSGGNLNLSFDDVEDTQLINITEEYNIFHWIRILWAAETIVLVDSSMMNLVEQLNLPNQKILYTRPNGRLPTIRNNWEIR
jgi:hypothetical protein